MNRRELLKAGVWGMTTSISTRFSFDRIGKYQESSALGEQVENLEKIILLQKTRLHLAEDDENIAQNEQAIYETERIAHEVANEYRENGGSLGEADAIQLAILSGTVALYAGNKFFDVFSQMEHTEPTSM